jgi:hypothetical protein
MLVDLIQAPLVWLEASTLSEFFLLLIVGIFVWLGVSSRQQKHQKMVAYAPGLLTSMGILGTFAGIMSGLMDFDPRNIDESIEGLLGGMTMAFMTSLAGMFASMLFKTLQAYGIFSVQAGSHKLLKDDVQPKDILHSLNNLSEGFCALHKAIAGNEDSSLIGQFKNLRSDMNDHHTESRKQFDKNHQKTEETLREVSAQQSAVIVDSAAQISADVKTLKEEQQHHHQEQLAQAQSIHQTEQDEFKQAQEKLWAQLTTFADILSKSATEQIIAALNQVINDFNNNLTEQFGDNFKALDASVHKLVQWQENYRDQLADMHKQYSHGVESITQTETALTNIRSESAAIPDIMGQLKTVMEVNQQQLKELASHLKAFADMRDKAVEAVPEIQKTVDKTVTDMTQAVDAMTTGLLDSSGKIREVMGVGIDDMQDNMTRMNKSMTSTATELSQDSDAIQKTLHDSSKDLNETMSGMMSDLSQSAGVLQQETQKMHKNTLDSITDTQKQVQISVDQMMEESKKSIIAMHTQFKDSMQSGQQEMSQTVQQTRQNVEKQIDTVDQSMQREIDRVMTEMGKALAQIANTFTQDYRKLTEAMADVVQQGV